MWNAFMSLVRTNQSEGDNMSVPKEPQNAVHCTRCGKQATKLVKINGHFDGEHFRMEAEWLCQSCINKLIEEEIRIDRIKHNYQLKEEA